MPNPLPEGARGPSVIAQMHLEPPRALVVLTGELDLHSIDRLGNALQVVLEAQVHELVLDLTDVDFASLAAIGALTDAALAVARREGRATIRGASPLHRRVITLLGASPELVVVEPRTG